MNDPKMRMALEAAEKRIPTKPRERFIAAAEAKQREAQSIFVNGYLAGWEAARRLSGGDG